jgi:hypothetical protein
MTIPTFPEGVVIEHDEDGALVATGPGFTRCVRWPATCAEVRAAQLTYSAPCDFCSGRWDEGDRPRRRLSGDASS